MNRKSLVASFGLIACLAAALSAQAPSSNGKVDQKAVQSIRSTKTGSEARCSSTTEKNRLSGSSPPSRRLQSYLTVVSDR
jgi:hypothetical protein